MSGFYEEDEDPEEIQAFFNTGRRGVTSPPFGRIVGESPNRGSGCQVLDTWEAHPE
jgi:hypothetical protein